MIFSSDVAPTYGDQIRVNRGLYFHYGVFIDENNVIQFGNREGNLNAETAEIMIISLKDFLRNNILEVGILDKEELLARRSPQDTVNYGLSLLGTRGYSILNNNCEHFANDCLFGVKKSTQSDKVTEILKKVFK